MTKNKILLVDDEADFLILTSKRLIKEGYVVETAPCGMICIEKVHSFMPDLILLDIRMPRKDGWEVCEELSKAANTQKIPILLLTALLQNDVAERAAHLGVRGILSKPFNTEKLLKMIKEIMTGNHD